MIMSIIPVVNTNFEKEFDGVIKKKVKKKVNRKIMLLFLSWVLLIVWTGYSIYYGNLVGVKPIFTFLLGLGLGFFLSLLKPER